MEGIIRITKSKALIEAFKLNSRPFSQQKNKRSSRFSKLLKDCANNDVFQ